MSNQNDGLIKSLLFHVPVAGKWIRAADDLQDLPTEFRVTAGILRDPEISLFRKITAARGLEKVVPKSIPGIVDIVPRAVSVFDQYNDRVGKKRLLPGRNRNKYADRVAAIRAEVEANPTPIEQLQERVKGSARTMATASAHRVVRRFRGHGGGGVA